jgi:prepilin-type N-terminal cleavage/methylation domain-containing protein
MIYGLGYAMRQGFTLMELIVVVAIIGILSAIGVPYYIGYTENSENKIVQNNLRAIYMQQQEYYRSNAEYYSTGGTCGDATAAINTNLFDGENMLTNSDFYYCIVQSDVDDFTAQAVNSDSGTNFTINQNNVTNF